MDDLASTIKAVQRAVGVNPDGIAGPLTWAAIAGALKVTIPAGEIIHRALASSFADEADLEAFRKCKAKHKTDEECFKVGDNGIGFWGHNTAQEETPMVALPPEVIEDRWNSLSGGYEKQVNVTYNGETVACLLGDIMPHLANIHNGAGIDLNPAAIKQLGIGRGAMVPVDWSWA